MIRPESPRSQSTVDGKYELTAELLRGDHMTLYQARRVPASGREGVTGEGEALRLGWFEVTSPAERSSFHRYRSALKALAPAGLLDVVARPGAYYTVWQPLPVAAGGAAPLPLDAYLAQPVKDEETVQALRDLSTQLAESGLAIPDAEVVVGPGSTVSLAYVAPPPGGELREQDEAAGVSAAALSRLSRGRVRRRRPALSVLAILPGLLFLGGAGYLGAKAMQIWLNPPVREVASVAGKPAEQAARTLASGGFRVVYADGERPGLPVGAVVSQDPPAGAQLPVGRQITLTINDPPPLTVPRLEEQTLAQVQSLLAESRLSTGQVITVDGSATNTPKGHVIAQLPPAGATAQRGDKVTLLVSSGTEGRMTWLPPLTGLSFDDARDLARRAGLVVNDVRRQNSDARENTVLAQSPAAYQRVEVGSPVTLTVATAQFTGPSRDAGSLPLPPALPQAQAPSAPQVGQDAQTPADQAGTQTPAQEQGAAAQATQTPATQAPAAQSPAAQTSAAQTPTSATPSSTQEQAPASAATRTVRLSYTFPATLPEGTVDILVRDEDGERTVLAPTATNTVAGATAQQDNVQVRGSATFIVRVNGQVLTSFPAQ